MIMITIPDFTPGYIDGLQSRDETAMLVDKTIANYGSYFA